MKKLLFFVVLLLLTVPGFSQGTAGEDANYEHRYLIDMPTAGVLKKGFVGVSSDVLPYGILIARIEVGVFESVSFGISYGGANIIGSGSPRWYELPAANIKYRIMQESLLYPSLTLGFDTQGKGEYFDSTDRYAIKSPGLFVAGSKNFAFWGFLSVHGSLNYSFEKSDGDNFVNLTVGVEKTIGKQVSVMAEYDFALNDDSKTAYGKGNGYMNFGVRWTPGVGFTLGLDLRDILSNKKWSPGAADRGIRLEYIRAI
ncbi:MAG: hypothetical protein HUU54_14230 [Ignavibacteriaceae bacterium]|nr:hypothetical protein [Ignavibacteriaceae bacterium]